MHEGIPPELEGLGKLHGHLGPYVIIGYKMGALARKKLGEGMMFATVETGHVKPLSCIIDGIQFSTSCTLGKGNLEVKDNHIPRASFKKGDKMFRLRLKDDVWKKIERETVPEKELELSIHYYNVPDEELFEYGEVLDTI